MVRPRIGREAVHTAQLVAPRLSSAKIRLDVRLDTLTRAKVEELAMIVNCSSPRCCETSCVGACAPGCSRVTGQNTVEGIV
jgi:hypothetical protein